MFKVIHTTTTEKSCAITALFENFYITAVNINTDTQTHINHIEKNTLEIMKKFIISENLLSKVKALLKAGQVNVVIQCHEKHGILNKLNHLQELTMEKREKRKRESFYDVCYTGVSPVTDVEYTNQVLIASDYQLDEKDIKEKVWQKFQLSNIRIVIREIQKEEFNLIKEDIHLLSDY